MLVVLSMLFAYAPAEEFLLRRSERSRDKAAARWRRAAAWPRSETRCPSRVESAAWKEA
jgi:hypothetical protein